MGRHTFNRHFIVTVDEHLKDMDEGGHMVAKIVL